MTFRVNNPSLRWWQAPIPDAHPPGTAFAAQWLDMGELLRRRPCEGRNVLVHCLGGLGRTVTIAPRLLIELDFPAADAIRQVRDARSGAIETSARQDHPLIIPCPPMLKLDHTNLGGRAAR